jgi:hypothetical protein
MPQSPWGILNRSCAKCCVRPGQSYRRRCVATDFELGFPDLGKDPAAAAVALMEDRIHPLPSVVLRRHL